MGKSEWVCGLAYLCVLATLPVVGNWARQGQNQFCAFNGGPIEPLYGVRIIEGESSFGFCCVECATNWLKDREVASGDTLGGGNRPMQTIFVVDEISGTEIDAATAYFVRSLTVTNRVTGNRIHAFKNQSDAELHARSLGSSLLAPKDGPFAGQLLNKCPHCSPSKD